MRGGCKRAGPHSPLGTDCLWAFGVGGGICLLGEVLRQWYLGLGLEADLAGTLTSCTLIALSAVLTTLGLYQKLAARAGAGSLVPITGFANAVVSAAIEFKTEGRVLGTGAKMFTIAGPVIVYGTLAAVLYGGVLWLLRAADSSHLPYALPGAKIALSRRFSSIPQNPQKNIPERREFFMATRRGDTLTFQTPPVIAAHAAVGGKKEGKAPCGGLRCAERRQPVRPVRLGSRRDPAAAAGGAALPEKSAGHRKRGQPGSGRRPAGPVHGFQLRHADAGHPLCGAVRGLQHHGRSAGCWGLRSARPGWPTACWPWRPAISAPPNASSAPR